MVTFETLERSGWAAAAPVYGTRFGRSTAFVQPIVAGLVRETHCRLVLNAGSGPGGLAPSFDASGVRVVASDLTLEMLQQVAAADRVQADVQRLPFKRGRFDLTAAVFVLNHVRRADLAFRELVRVTRQGGIVFAVVWDPTSAHIAALEQAMDQPERSRADEIEPARLDADAMWAMASRASLAEWDVRTLVGEWAVEAVEQVWLALSTSTVRAARTIADAPGGRVPVIRDRFRRELLARAARTSRGRLVLPVRATALVAVPG